MFKGFVSDFKSYIMGGNVVGMAIGIVIGAAFSSIVPSLVSNVIMPPIQVWKRLAKWAQWR
jgi:large conductance mechanosensitive channel